MKFKILTLFLLGNLITSVCLSQTTGKIIGKISDVETSEVLIGVNIMLLGTDFGAASDINGDFFLINDFIPEFGIINAYPMPVNEVEREEGFDPADPMAVRFRWVTQGNQILEN